MNYYLFEIESKDSSKNILSICESREFLTLEKMAPIYAIVMRHLKCFNEIGKIDNVGKIKIYKLDKFKNNDDRFKITCLDDYFINEDIETGEKYLDKFYCNNSFKAISEGSVIISWDNGMLFKQDFKDFKNEFVNKIK